ncbi:MAG: ATP-binding protein, partial [Muribaculaceae bacterium]|nr:ATP-binding protein [Muribaculaceae bacterium]
MINRKIFNTLYNKLQNSKKAILVTGARQVGKTFIIRQLGAAHYKHFIEINMLQEPELATMFSRTKSADDILIALSTHYGKRMVAGQTLFFFDEVQECPDIVTKIKFLVDQSDFKYVLSGSLLGVELNDLRSEPVGYLDTVDMFPLDFEEFVIALGVGNDVLAALRNAFEQHEPVNDHVHQQMMKYVRLYLLTGGMPAAVQKYLDTHNLRLVADEQLAILRLYKKDISKYDTGNKLYLNEIFELIPPELNAKNKRFILKNLNENVKFSRFENSFLWMKNAGVAIPTYNIEEPKLPLLLARSRNLFKLFQNDVGLLAAQYATSVQLRILEGDDKINFGSIYENFVAQELTAHGFNAYYYNSKKNGEVDFVIEHNDQVLPIEVKSGKDYARHRALDRLMASPEYDLPQAFVLCNDNVSTTGRIACLPVYMTMFLHKRQASDLIYHV